MQKKVRSPLNLPILPIKNKRYWGKKRLPQRLGQGLNSTNNGPFQTINQSLCLCVSLFYEFVDGFTRNLYSYDLIMAYLSKRVPMGKWQGKGRWSGLYKWEPLWAFLSSVCSAFQWAHKRTNEESERKISLAHVCFGGERHETTSSSLWQAFWVWRSLRCWATTRERAFEEDSMDLKWWDSSGKLGWLIDGWSRRER